MVPLFFVGDKPFYYYGQKLLKDLNIPLLVDGAGNQTEQMEFKIGFCGIDQKLNNNPHLMFSKEYQIQITTMVQLSVFN